MGLKFVLIQWFCPRDIFGYTWMILHTYIGVRGARWPSGQCAQRAIAEAKQRWSVIGWVIKIYYLELLRVSEGTLSCWSRLHLQSLAPTPVSRRVDVRQAADCKNNCQIFTHDEKHVVPKNVGK
jgi:hypothetical protein